MSRQDVVHQARDLVGPGLPHVNRPITADLVRRFWTKFEVGEPDECWPWAASVCDGYGIIRWDGSAGVAHRLAYELMVGPIPPGLMIDHTCHDPKTCTGGPSCLHRRCVNPAHMEPVTNRENVLRGCTPKTHCPQGHPYAGDNLKLTPTGGRFCRACHRADARRAYAARREMMGATR